MSIGLFLMTKKGYSVLASLIENCKIDTIDFVCIGKDSKLDNDYSKEIAILCERNYISFYLNNSLEITSLKSNYYIAVAWRWLIELPNLIILHDSVLPKYRGFAPLVNMLINGEKELGVTAIFASEEYDKGDVILQERIVIDYPIKIAKVIDIISELYSLIILNIFTLIEDNAKLVGIKQEEGCATYSLWLDEEDYFIDWNMSAEKIKRKIDACGSPYEGAKCWLEKEIVIIKEAILIDDVKIENRVSGKIIFINGNYPVVVCGNGLLMITEAVSQVGFQNVLPLNKFRIKFK